MMRNLADVLLDQVPRVTASTERCKRVRFRRSQCRRCVEVCPDNAIALDPAPSVASGCAGCGLCVTVCPTEAFRDERQSDEHLLRRLLSELGSDPTTLTIRCQQASAAAESASRIPCLGRLTETIIVGIALAGVKHLEIVPGRCTECRWHHGDKSSARAVAAAGLILEAFGHAGLVVITREAQRTQPEPVSRRAFFGGRSREAGHRPAGLAPLGETALRDVISQPMSREGSGLTSSRSLLGRLLDGMKTPALRPVRTRPECQWAVLRIDPTKCSFCSTCEAVCPAGAIVRRTEDGYGVLRFTGVACMNCGLCQEACPGGAVGFDNDALVSEALSREPVAVARIALAWCAACGEPMPDRGYDVCSTCRKRQLRPMPVAPGGCKEGCR